MSSCQNFFVHLKTWTLLSLQWVGREFPHTWEMWEASSRRRSMRTSDTTLNREKVGRFSIQLKSVLQFRIGKRYEDSPSNCIVCTTSVFTTVLRHICIEYCWRNPYFAFMSAPPCLFAFPFTPHFDVHLLLDLFHVTKTCSLTNQKLAWVKLTNPKLLQMETTVVLKTARTRPFPRNRE